ncbi:MAG: CDP-diacylglycerol--glycerol-3-phosphate 3-phosphatidyltransferase [Deltaproteobacteria bacterium]|nr:MAG: CDP-diacylglycerol--glycerol-3-phosphate 3-phosphatidyltransferase [Deltaproteobacteria bacterium]
MTQNESFSALTNKTFSTFLSHARLYIKEPSNLPNLLTLSRIFSVPLIIVLLYTGNRWINLLTALLVTLAAITDGLDGYMARKYGFESDFGKLLDPLADKILILSTMVMLVYLHRAPAWMVCLILCRETAITGMRAMAADRGKVIGASAMAKYKTIFQTVAIVALVIHYPFLGADAHAVGIFFLWIAFVYTMWTGYNYFRDTFSLLMTD